MRRPIFMMLLASSAMHIDSFAQQQPPAVTQLSVQAQAGVKELECEKPLPPVRKAVAANPDPMELPSAEMVQNGMQEDPPADALPAGVLPAAVAASLPAIRPVDGYRVAIWGDSHLAAGFFTQELVKLLKLPANAEPGALIPASMGRAGVRLPIRRSCVSSGWQYEPAYLGGAGGAAPGPGLVNMVSDQAGSTLSWDVRDAASLPRYERVRILYQQSEAPMVIGVSVDGGVEKEVRLGEKAGPAVLELVADQPISQVTIRLVDARFRFHGLELFSKKPAAFQLDVFGYPGATIAGWKSANLAYLNSWFQQSNYQLVMLEFGTNEGNAKPFNLAGYRKTLVEAVGNMRSVFPTAACVLIAPGDRGVLVPRSLNVRVKNTLGQRGRHKTAEKHLLAHAPANTHHGQRKSPPKVDVFHYSRIHLDIEQVQAEVAANAGCSSWSMLHAMGGMGSSYKWARQSPALMSSDMIHFTVAGYQRLAQQFATDMGWRAMFVGE